MPFFSLYFCSLSYIWSDKARLTLFLIVGIFITSIYILHGVTPNVNNEFCETSVNVVGVLDGRLSGRGTSVAPHGPRSGHTFHPVCALGACPSVGPSRSPLFGALAVAVTLLLRLRRRWSIVWCLLGAGCVYRVAGGRCGLRLAHRWRRVRSLAVLPCRWPGRIAKPPRCCFGRREGCCMSSCNGLLRLPPSTNYLPLCRWFVFWLIGVLIKLLDFCGLEATICHILPSFAVRCQT